MKAGNRESSESVSSAGQLWGELTAIDNSTYQERLFTVYKRGGSFLIVSDNGQERLAGPDSGVKKSDLFREVMDQFQVHALRIKTSVSSKQSIEPKLG
jgi:hypothetical protein